ncbi:outer membrane beta-barrel protein [Pontiella agarivorans]|uniref:Outer membrane beta-barrel protein n=1 Tax=Pontiella agarivorans TaxID=3038953 RepID=A0ABU5MZZ0_9BACT|nr:outer membrane beta-barrel protein [Pontiella agarivorans]MDZ8119772.1 outer membrane beta-barrel protein [Pontiella agarivorans]
MTNRTLQVLIALTFVSAASFAAKERVIRFQNHVRIGYDDNIYQTKNATDSGFITDIINLSAKFNFSSRTDALVYWEPEFQYRFDADPEFVSYQNLYAQLNHALSQRTFLTLSDRFRYQQKDGQSDYASQDNQNYFENDLLGSVDYTLNEVSFIKLGLGYEFRIWDDSDYGEWQGSAGGGNNYDLFKADGSYFRQLNPEKTQIMGGVNYGSLTYDGDRGGYDSVTFLVGADQNFTPTVSGFGRVGYTLTSVDNAGGGSEDTSSPYLSTGLEVNPSARTSVTTSLGYSLYRSQNSIYNAQDRFNVTLGARHDITAKIALSSSLSYIYSYYDGSYALAGSGSNAKDNFVSLGLRCSYQVNRNNFVELGYLFRTRNVSGNTALNDWDGNRLDAAWRLRL